MLGQASLSRRGAVAGAATVVVVGLASGYTAWAQQPERRVTRIALPPRPKLSSRRASEALASLPTPPPQQPQRPVTRIATPAKAAWTPMSGAPAGLLTPLEGGRHDTFIDRARAGDIDIVFFGTTDTEMWRWPDRGRSVWDQAFGSLKAANFGSQGTRFESLLWRMQNGELDGYQAKLVVLQAVRHRRRWRFPSDRQAEFVAGYTASSRRSVRDSRKRRFCSPPPFRAAGWIERSGGGSRRRTPRCTASSPTTGPSSTSISATAFSFPTAPTTRRCGHPRSEPNAGIHEPAFKVWAEELQPWLDRFVP